MVYATLCHSNTRSRGEQIIDMKGEGNKKRQEGGSEL